ncbi:hypothetical protein [Chryseobacterium sp.]|uniref:hypothetical protein n=1 Tax=Chryseobacterium sp. TaxID=1871047 RepID=UPI002898F335|nr:hypothetical protein [Chryseobacterium sp.]
MKIKLSTGKEIELTAEELKELKPIIDKEFASLDENLYLKLKWSKPEIIREALENMALDELIEFAKFNDSQIEYSPGYRADAFTTKIRQELFKRHGLGYKQAFHLSFKQRDFLKSLGLKEK